MHRFQAIAEIWQSTGFNDVGAVLGYADIGKPVQFEVGQAAGGKLGFQFHFDEIFLSFNLGLFFVILVSIGQSFAA